MYGPEFERDYTNLLFEEQLKSRLLYINKDLPQIAIREAIAKLKDIENGSLEQKNSTFMYYLQKGISVIFLDENTGKSIADKLIEFHLRITKFLSYKYITIVNNLVNLTEKNILLEK